MRRAIPSVLGALLLVAVIVVVMQQRQIERLRAECAALRPKTNTPVSVAPPATKPTATGGAARIQAAVQNHAANGAASWEERAALLKEVLAELPEQNIPELSLATEDDWLDAARGKLETADDYRRAFAKLRNASVGHFAILLEHAVRKYVAANGGAFPESVAALQPLSERPVDAAIWDRYIVAPASTVPSLGFGGDRIITNRSVVDVMYDKTFGVGPNGSGNTDFGMAERTAVYGAYHNSTGAWPKNPADALPYATTSIERAVIQADVDRFRAQQAGPTSGH